MCGGDDFNVIFFRPSGIFASVLGDAVKLEKGFFLALARAPSFFRRWNLFDRTTRGFLSLRKGGGREWINYADILKCSTSQQKMSGNCLLIFILVFVRVAIIFFALSLSVVVDRGASVLVLAGAYEKKRVIQRKRGTACQEDQSGKKRAGTPGRIWLKNCPAESC